MNKIEHLKTEKDGLAVLAELDRFAREGWESIPDADLERLKWLGIFHRKATPGFFMMRVRVTHGVLSAEAAEALAGIASAFGQDAVDLTTRQQVQLRWLKVEDLPEVMRRLSLVGLTALQTGMDSIRNVVGCPIAGLDQGEVIHTLPIARHITRAFLRNPNYTNLPRKFNIALSGCVRDCCHSGGHDVGLTPALGPNEQRGFNLAMGGALGGSDPRYAVPLDAFVLPEHVRDLCLAALDLFREHGPRETRTRCRLKYLLDEWGTLRFRDQLERRLGAPLPPAGRSLVTGEGQDHLGIQEQAQRGLYYAGLYVPVGRIGARLLRECARLSREYGSGEMRLTTQQNLLVTGIPESRLAAFQEEPALRELPLEPSNIRRSVVCCTGNDHCHFALIDTKGLTTELMSRLEAMAPWKEALRIHISGCPHACGQHRMADLGLQGARIKVGNAVVPAADVFVGGRGGPVPVLGTEVGSKVPWADLPALLADLGRKLESKSLPDAPITVPAFATAAPGTGA